ncbi:Meiotic nuclear division 1 [Chlorella sorokiniana]|uniref:Meiotic nuclear division 1 n=1 Tax=Chlorella sorokiniana TaxID=3076 RepID=A0A2P6TDQ2_CHLSO|nr:Meiotic nuclear division 1 [Chlorella sorokiniana]|eukprot:PRW20778.1 Meiotic nuclear division 1 [Chlorella sorokiniana]
MRRALGSSDASDAEGGSGSGSGDSGQTDEVQELLRLRAQAARLNELFFAPAAPGASEAAGAAEQSDGEEACESSSPSAGSLRIPNLPLWRVQWAALPGAQEVLHIHVPHYTSMFERLFRTPRPWRYGSLYLPNGSKNLDNPEFALEPGTKAPLAGTLMEVLQAVRFADGRLLVLAVGVGRFRVAQATQSTPYWRADVELLIDSEEQQQYEPLALQALESVQDGLAGSSSSGGSSSSSSSSEPGGEASSSGNASSSIPLTALMTAVPVAARAAAAASSAAWVDYELADAREESATGEQNGLPAVIDGSKAAEAQRMGRRLAAIAGNEVLPMPFFDQLLSAAQAAAAPGIREVIPSSTEPASLLQSAVDAQRAVLRQTAASAYALASSAAAAAIERLTAAGSSSSEGGGSSGELREAATATVAAARLNTAAERGVEVQPAEDVLGEDALDSEPDSLAVALRLESAVWVELDAISVLANKLRERELPLPNGMQSLRPMAVPGSSGGSSSGGSDSDAPAETALLQAGAHPDWPALRRLQHLSYAVTSQLANISASEGRQAFVEAPSICARLRLGLAALRKHRQVLAAVVAAARAAFGSAADPPEDQHTHVLGLLASGLLAASATAFALEECARRGQAYLLTFTADTLKLGLVAFAAMNIALQVCSAVICRFYYPRTLTAAAAIASGLAMSLLAALPASQLLVAPEDRARVWNDFRRLPRDLLSGMWLRRSSLPGALYLLLTIAFPVAGLAYFLAPNTTLYHTFGYVYGKSTAMVWKGIGAGLMTILPAMTFTLKDKAENELLGRSIARTLNLGLMAAAIGHLLVLGNILNHGIGGFLLPAVTATWGTALLASMAGLAAPEVAAIAEQTAEAARSMD